MAGNEPSLVMAELVPAIPLRQVPHVRQFYLYILASRPGGAIYIGVTGNLVRRAYEYRNGLVEGHTKRLHIHRLVYFEVFSTARDAIQREKNMKHWPRAWKTRLMQKAIRRGVISTRRSPHRRALLSGMAGTSPAMTEVNEPSVDSDYKLLILGPPRG